MVIGVGNAWRRDDAAGLEVARLLRDRVGPGVRVVELEGEPSSLISAWEDAGDVTVVDAVSSGAEPGTVHRLDAAAGPVPAAVFGASTHALGVADAVEIARALGRLPERLEVIGIEGADFGAGEGVDGRVAEAAERVAGELERRLGR